MSRELQGASLARCLLVWMVASALSSAVAGTALRGYAEVERSSFGSLLTAGCAMALVGCATWCWLVTTVTVAGAIRGHDWRLPGAPAGLIRVVLSACGVALLMPAGPAWAGADPPPSAVSAVAGLPLPERPEVPVEPAERIVVVRPGDSLWTIAAERGCTWTALYAANRAVVGPDPDLIHPGAVLRLPREES
jgi:hypothetical protein